MEYLARMRGGVYAEFLHRQTPFSTKMRENHNFSCQIFSIQKNHLLRPRFLKSPGSEDTIFPYRYFWHTNLQFFARISWKMGSVHKFFLHRPPGGPFPNRRPVRWWLTLLCNTHSMEQC